MTIRAKTSLVHTVKMTLQCFIGRTYVLNSEFYIIILITYAPKFMYFSHIIFKFRVTVLLNYISNNNCDLEWAYTFLGFKIKLLYVHTWESSTIFTIYAAFHRESNAVHRFCKSYTVTEIV